MFSNSRSISGIGQRGGRLVQDQQAAVLGERAGDFDQLLLAHPKLVGGCGRVQVAQPNAGQRLPRLLMQFRETRQTRRGAAARLRKMFSATRQRADDVQLLHAP